MKKIFIAIITLLFLLSFRINTFASTKEKYVIPGGESIGLKIETGIEVIGKYTVETNDGKKNPWANSQIDVGDYILKVNNVSVKNNQELIKVLKNVSTEVVNLELKHNNKTINTSINVVKTKLNEPSIGLYIKDKMLGIGTLSFIYEDKFASLGHGVYENNELIEQNDGKLTLSKVMGIKKATLNQAGEKRAAMLNNEIGTIKSIKETGVYGTINYNIRKEKIKVANIDEVKLGPAKIYTVIDGETVKAYDIEIINTLEQDSISTKGIKIRIIDPTLINITGGIVQGMSGSPIIQNGMLVGAISHVTIENPTIGYGMYAKWMLEDLCN
jgi:stage IV sporulation protein B